MICFHFCIFVVLATTAAYCYDCGHGLWFAFIFVSLSYWQQHNHTFFRIGISCDLLSFLYLCRTGNNRTIWENTLEYVVICFHFCIFVVLATTHSTSSHTLQMLWFAFIFVSLSYWQQQWPRFHLNVGCCDLLSFLYLCRTGNNLQYCNELRFCVVICFHFCIFVVLATTCT